MAGLRRKLPPLTGLVTFEAAARLRSFTRAADELGVTQAAVSRQIHLLEDALGLQLFHRLHRRVELTERGRALASATSTALNLLTDSIAEISETDQGDELVISATVAFSHFWLLPKVSLFSRLHPEVKLRILAQDDQQNIAWGEVDIAIRYGNGMWPDARAEFLFRDRIFPVCSADFAAANPGMSDLADVMQRPLIIHDWKDPLWIGWEAWLANLGTELPKKGSRFVCSSYIDSIYAALNGQGVALGWGRLIEDLMAQGRLVQVTNDVLPTNDAYHAVVPNRARKKASVPTFLNWLSSLATGEER